MTTQTIAQPEPLLGSNGRTVIVPRGPAPDDAGDMAVVVAPGCLMFLGGRYNGVDQWFGIDPGEAFPRIVDALEQGRVIANGGVIDDEHPPSDRAVIAALRLATYEGYAKDDKALDVVRQILGRALPSEPHGVSGANLLVNLIREGRLRAEVTPA